MGEGAGVRACVGVGGALGGARGAGVGVACSFFWGWGGLGARVGVCVLAFSSLRLAAILQHFGR